MFRGDAFRDWVTGPGGLNEASARSYLDYLGAIERQLGVDIPADWDASRLKDVTSRLMASHEIDSKTRSNYRSAPRKYEEFRQLSGA